MPFGDFNNPFPLINPQARRTALNNAMVEAGLEIISNAGAGGFGAIAPGLAKGFGSFQSGLALADQVRRQMLADQEGRERMELARQNVAQGERSLDLREEEIGVARQKRQDLINRIVSNRGEGIQIIEELRGRYPDNAEVMRRLDFAEQQLRVEQDPTRLAKVVEDVMDDLEDRLTTEYEYRNFTVNGVSVPHYRRKGSDEQFRAAPVQGQAGLNQPRPRAPQRPRRDLVDYAGRVHTRAAQIERSRRSELEDALDSSTRATRGLPILSEDEKVALREELAALPSAALSEALSQVYAASGGDVDFEALKRAVMGVPSQDEIIPEIRELMNEGRTDEEISQALSRVGYGPSEVAQLLRMSRGGA